MSNRNKNKDAATVAAEPKQRKKKNVSYRLLAVLFAAACVAALFLPLNVFVKNFAIEEKNFLKIAKAILDSDTEIFGFIPVLTGKSTLGIASSGALYFFALTLALGFVLCLIAVFTAKSSPALVRTAIFFVTCGAAAYAISVLAISSYSSSLSLTFDWWSIAVAGFGAVWYFVLMLAKVGKAAWLNAVQLLLSLASTALLLLALTRDRTAVSAFIEEKKLYEICMLAAVGVSFANLLITAIRLTKKKGLTFDICRYILVLLVAAGACCLNYLSDMKSKIFATYAILAAGTSFVQLLIASLQLKHRKGKKVRAPKEKKQKRKVSEERVSAMPYEGEPVAVNMAKEVRPVENPSPVFASDCNADYGKKFDAFMTTLAEEERTQFIDLYIIRCNGPMPEIPKYDVGGDNREFFNKVFIYLGQYREKIPGVLLSKMYQFSMKIN